MVNNSTNKTNNHHLSPQTIELKKDQDTWHWKSRSGLEHVFFNLQK